MRSEKAGVLANSDDPGAPATTPMVITCPKQLMGGYMKEEVKELRHG